MKKYSYFIGEQKVCESDSPVVFDEKYPAIKERVNDDVKSSKKTKPTVTATVEKDSKEEQ